MDWLLRTVIRSCQAFVFIDIVQFIYILGWQLSKGFFLENQRQFFRGTK